MATFGQGTITFSDGEVFNTHGPYRTEYRRDGWYVLGNGFMSAVKSQEEGKQLIEKLTAAGGK